MRGVAALALALVAASGAARADCPEPPPELQLVRVVAPAQAALGTSVVVEVELLNAGRGAAAGYALSVHLSPDSTLSQFDRRLGEAPGPALAPGEVATVEVTTTIPDDADLRDYTLGVVADPANVLCEPAITRADNVRGADATTEVKAPAADFTLRRLTWGRQAAAGEVAPVELAWANVGVRSGEARVVLYLSTAAHVTRDDLAIGELRIAGAPGVEGTELAWVRLPGGLAPSTWYLGAWVDPDDELAELREDNNVALSAPATVTAASLGIQTAWLPDALLGFPYVRSLVASGGDGADAWRLAEGSLPAGLTLSTGGVITGIATEEGVFHPVVEVSSGARTARAGLVLRARPPTTALAVATLELPPAFTGRDYSVPLAAVGGSPPYRWRAATGRLPDGLAIETETSRISGRPTIAGAETFELEVRDGSGNTARHTFTLRVLAQGTLAIGQVLLASARAGEPYRARISPLQGLAPYRWSLASGRLPAGLALVQEGDAALLDGTPLVAGHALFALRVEDASGQSDRQGFALSIAEGTVEILTTELPDAERGLAYDVQLAASSARATWRIVSGTLPAGLDLSEEGRLTSPAGVVPATAPLGLHTFLVEVTDGAGAFGRAGLAVRIGAAPGESDGGCAGAPAGVWGLLVLAWWMRRGGSAAPTPAAARPSPWRKKPRQREGLDDDAWMPAGRSSDLHRRPRAGSATGRSSRAGRRHMVAGRDSPSLCRSTIATGGGARGSGGRGHAPAPRARRAELRTHLPWHLVRAGIAAISLVFATPAAAQVAAEYFARTEPEPSYPALTAGQPALLRSSTGPCDGDDCDAVLPLPFEFPYFGERYRAVRLALDGYLTFGADGLANQNQALPDPESPNAVVAVWWDDLSLVRPGQPPELPPSSSLFWASEGVAPNRRFTVEWRRVLRRDPAGSEAAQQYTFQVQLHESGLISLHYAHPEARDVQGLPLPPGAFDATLGLEDPTGSQASGALACRSHCAAADFPAGRRLVMERRAELLPGTIVAPPVAWAELPARFSMELRNVGSLPASDVVARLHLSTDRVLDAHDLLIWEPPPVSLDRGARVTLTSADVVLPAAVAAGSWFPIVALDPVDAIDEVSEANNVVVGEPLRIGAPGPDFRPLSASLDRTRVSPGDELRVALAITNRGNRAGSTTWRLLASRNDFLSLADRTLATGDVTLGPGEIVNVSEGFRLPTDLAGGVYSVGVLVDAPDDPDAHVPELDEFDNACFATSGAPPVAQALHVGSSISVATDTLPAAAKGAFYSFRLGAAGGDGLAHWSVGPGSDLPAGLALRSTGDLEGIPTVAGAGTFTVRVASGTDVAERALTLDVADPAVPLRLVTAMLPAPLVGRTYDARLTAHGGTPPYRFSLGESTPLPAGLGFEPNGALGGVARVAGLSTLAVTVEDALGARDGLVIVLEILGSDRPIVHAGTLPDALLGEAYAVTLRADGGTAPYTWTLDRTVRLGTGPDAPDTELDGPAGLALDSDGRLAGTPRELGLHALVVTVTDATGGVDTDTMILHVRATHGVALLTPGLPIARVGAAYDAPLHATGGDGLYTFALVDPARGPPTGLMLTPRGRLQGIPDAPGRWTFVVRVHDTAGRAEVRAFTLEVLPATDGCASAGAASMLLLVIVAAFRGLRRRRGALLSLVSIGLLACAGSPDDPCADALCSDGEACDPATGACVCGVVGVGRTCSVEESCDVGAGNCVLLDRCRLVTCHRGETCDRADGRCRCGTQACADDEQCDPTELRCVPADACAGVTCPGGLACDPADGQCRCGGATCEPGEGCVDGACVTDLCAASHCTDGMTCDPADGVCRCGGAGGVACLHGQRCLVEEARCVLDGACLQSCGGGTSCDPADGLCHCGAEGPVCGPGQTCDPERRLCLGGDRCGPCPGHTTCDPDDGLCRCGAAGPVCSSSQVCEIVEGSLACRTRCDPLVQAPCPVGEGCSWVVEASAGLCGVAGAGDDGASCDLAADCRRGMQCVTLGSGAPGSCRGYCARPGGLCAAPDRVCRAFPGAPEGLGACLP